MSQNINSLLIRCRHQLSYKRLPVQSIKPVTKLLATILTLRLTQSTDRLSICLCLFLLYNTLQFTQLSVVVSLWCLSGSLRGFWPRTVCRLYIFCLCFNGFQSRNVLGTLANIHPPHKIWPNIETDHMNWHSHQIFEYLLRFIHKFCINI